MYLNCQSYIDRGYARFCWLMIPCHAWDFARGRVAAPNCKLTRYMRHGIRGLRLVCDVPCISARQKLV